VSIAYLGQLYGAMRDPSPLYDAIKLSNLTPSDIQVEFYGPSEQDIYPLAEKFGVSSFVFVKPRVPHSQSLRIQRDSDALLLLQAPDDPRNLPAKVFEYFAAGRPILGVGLDEGVPASLIGSRGAGLYNSDPEAIARQLADWVEEKRRTGGIKDVPAHARDGLSRSEQLAGLEHFLTGLLPYASNGRGSLS
jgi:glycosyltransferase involved in cell wall biosynthesis